MIQQLVLTPEMTECYGDKTLLPKAKQAKGDMTKQQVLQARCPKSEDNLGTLVASYMRQHELPFHHLVRHGIFAELMINGEGQVSFVDPVRWAAMMGNLYTLFLPENLEDTFQLLGNCIAVPHAALALIIMLNHTICQEICIPAEQTINRMWADRTLVNRAVVIDNENGFAILTPDDFLMIGPICRYNQITEDNNPQLIAFVWPDGSHTQVEYQQDQTVKDIFAFFGVPEYLHKMWGFRALGDDRIIHGSECFDNSNKLYEWVFLPNAPEKEIKSTVIDTPTVNQQPISPTLPWTSHDPKQDDLKWIAKNVHLSSGDMINIEVPETYTLYEVGEIFDGPDPEKTLKVFAQNEEIDIFLQIKHVKGDAISFKRFGNSQSSQTMHEHTLLKKVDLILTNGSLVQVEMNPNRSVDQLIATVESMNDGCTYIASVKGKTISHDTSLANLPVGEMKICKSLKRKADDFIFTNLEVRTLDGSTRIIPTTRSGTIKEALLEAAFPIGLIQKLRPTCQGKIVSIDARIDQLQTSHIVLRAFPLCGGAPKNVTDPFTVNDPWASFKATTSSNNNAMGGNTRWDQLLLEADHPWHTKDGNRVKQVSILQLGPKVGGVAFGTRNNLSMMTNFQPTLPTLILLPGLKDNASYDPSLKTMMMPSQQVVVKEPNGKQYKRIVIPLVLKGEFIYKLSSEPLATAPSTDFAELVLEVHEALVNDSIVKSIKEHPLEFFRKHMSTIPVAMKELSIYSYRKIQGKDGLFIHQVLMKIPEDNRKGLLTCSGCGEVFARQFLQKDEQTDHSLLPKYWTITSQDLKQVMQLGQALNTAFAGIALTSKGLAIRAMNASLAEARSAILQDDVRFTDRNRHVVTRHFFLAQGFPFGVSHEAIVESIFEAIKIAAVPLRSFKLAGMITWIVGFDSIPAKLQFVIAFGTETHEILLTKQEDQKPNAKNGRKKDGGNAKKDFSKPTGMASASKKPMNNPPIVTTSMGTKDADTEHRLAALEGKVQGLETSHKTLASKVDNRFDDISSQLQKVLQAVTQGPSVTHSRGRENTAPTGETPPPKVQRGS